jgi:pimeloyl-ACP methyl ester carboxylesterase
MVPGHEEMAAAAVQFARFASVCKPYAPLYRQATVGSIPAVMGGRDPAPIFRMAYGDVAAAFHYYLDHYNHGRPFVLIGHSQGTIHATMLIQREIEGRPIAARMVSAILLGFNVEVPEGRDVGGTFQHTPLCTRVGQTGCVITYESFRAEAPPTGPGLFAYAGREGFTVGCTNPAALGSDAAAPLDSYWIATPAGSPGITWSSTGAPPAAFLHTQGLVSGQCMHNGRIGYFAIHVNADPHDARTDNIPGDVPLPGWGIHLIDVNEAQGDLIRAVAAQSAAFRAANP